MFQLEHAVLRLDGTQGWTSSRAIPMLDSRGEIVEWFGAASDITERKTAEGLVRKTEERYHTLFNSLIEGFCIVEVAFDVECKPIDYRFVEVNPSFEMQTGLRNVRGKWMREIAPDHEAHWFEIYGKVALTGESVRFLNEARSLGRWYDVSAYRLGGDESRKVAILFNDITESRRKTEALRESEQDFRSLAEAVPQIVWATRPDGWNIYFNQRWIDYTGLTLDESYGHGWNTPFHPDDKQKAWDAWQRATREKTPYSLECRLRRADGVYRWWLIRGTPMRNADGEIVKWFGTCTDVEEMKQAERALREGEARLALALEGGQMGFWEWDLRTSQSIWNAREYELLGLTPGDGRPQTDLFFRHVHPEDALSLENSLKHAQAAGSDWFQEFRIIRHDGQTRWLVGAGRIIFGMDKRPERMVGVNYDITERKEFQVELERLVGERTARLQELVTELEHFSYSIVHDMRAPLRSMSGFAGIAIELCASPELQEQRRLLQRISQSAGRMDSLITDALNYSEAVRKHLPLSPVDVSFLLRGMLDSYPEFLPSHANIQVQADIPLVFANEAGLTQCFSNLLNNAIQFVESGKFPEIRIRAELRDRSAEPPLEAMSCAKPFSPSGFAPIPSLPVPIQKEGPTRWVRIWVEDNGIGISESMLSRVFNMFTKGETVQSGTGIGLALVRKVADRMGGRVGVESVEGQGSRFWIELTPA